MPSIESDSFPPEDLYNRKLFTEHLASQIVDSDPTASLCIALTAPWGNGKTVTLEYLRQTLEKKEGISVIKFEPYVYEEHASLIKSLYTHLVKAIGQKDEQTAKNLGVVLRRFALVSKVAGYGLSLGVPGGVIGKQVLDLGADLLKRIAVINESKHEIRNMSPEQLLQYAHQVMKKSRVRVVLLIDEIDRLVSNEIQMLFRLIRMIANFPNTIYVAAFDREIVVRALDQQFLDRDKEKGTYEAGSKFLEKIFQLEVPLPFPERVVISRQMDKKLNEIIDSLISQRKVSWSKEEQQRFGATFQLDLLDAFRNLRVSKHYWSQLRVLLPLVVGEVNLTDFLILEAIRACDRSGYDAIRGNLAGLMDPALLSRERTEARTELRSEVLRAFSIPSAGHLIDELFPQIREHPPSEISRMYVRDMRLCAKEFSLRYFNYSVAQDDISSQLVVSLLDKAESDQDIREAIEKLASQSGDVADRLIDRLSLFDDTLTPTGARRLVEALGHNFECFSGRAGALAFSALDQAARVCVHALARLNASEAYKICENLIEHAEGLGGLAELLILLKRSENKLSPFGEKKWEALATKFADRLEAADASEPLYLLVIKARDNRFSIARFYWFIRKYAKNSELSIRLKKRFASRPDEVFTFMLGFVGITTSALDQYPSDLTSENYEFVGQLIEPKILVEILRTIVTPPDLGGEFPGHHQVAGKYDIDSHSGKLQAAQFIWFFEHPEGIEGRSEAKGVTPETQKTK